MKNITYAIVYAIVSFALVASVRAQFTAPATQSPFTKLSADKSSIPPSLTEAAAFQGSVDPKDYHMGPGDVIECRFWTSGDAFYPIVSSDNMLLIPNLGAFNTQGKTFAQIRDEVMQKAAESFAARKSSADNPPISLAIYQPRRILVKVQGDVATPGNYALTAATRADVAVDLANKLEPSAQPPMDAGTIERQRIEDPSRKRLQSYFGKRNLSPASERYITVTHGDGTTDRVDLIRYKALHDPKASEPLREGDVIVVPFRDLHAGSLGVYGAVQQGGDFEFVKGDSLSTAIRYAFGPSANADVHHVELSRVVPDGAADPPQIFDLAAIEAHTAPDVALEPNDRIIVRSLPEEHNAAVVILRGQVQTPGVYPIADGKTTLAELVHEAGGLTSTAYPAAGVLLRHGYEEQLTEGTPEEISQDTRLENLGVSDTTNFKKQMEMRPPNVNVDMERALVQGDHSADVTLRDGDEIDIPTEPTTVYVYGFVNNAGLVDYKEGAPLRYYIAQAGGYANGAESSETAIIKLRTKAWMNPGDTKIEPGDEIFVPKVPDLPENFETQNLATIGSLIVGIGGFIVGLYLAFLKKP